MFEPVFFERNRVGRVYTGGKLFHGFFGDAPVDNFEPEEWVASNVKAANKICKGEKEGVSKVKDSEVYFDDLLNQYPEEMLGGKPFRILVKLLDSAVRLPAQAHPDKPFSRKYFNSEYGKTESWIILDTRPGAKIYFGFKDGMTKEKFSELIDLSETDKDAMERVMEYYEPKIGDVFLVPAKTVHAIGAGCLLLEVQEPTDFTIQPEHWCDEYKLNDKEMYINLPKEDAIECFEFTKAPEAKIESELISEGENVKFETLINDKHTDCFVVNKISLKGGKHTMNVDDSYGVYIVTDGEGEIIGDGYNKSIKKGDYFFMPKVSMNKYTLTGNVDVIECY